MARDPEAIRARRLSWFDRGNEAINSVVRFDDPGDRRRACYMCPLCGVFYMRRAVDSHDLTDEHVPPKSVEGGRKRLLTCRECNNGAGRTVDKHAASGHNLRQVLTAKGGKVTAKFADGVPVEVAGRDGAVHFSLDRNRTRHASYDAWVDAYDARVDQLIRSGAPSTGAELFTFWVTGHDTRLESLSYLRAAYLLAFAVWGYKLILGPAYQPLRRQLYFPGERVLPALPLRDGPGGPSAIGRANHVVLGDTIVVQFGVTRVMLPARPTDVSWWERFDNVGRIQVPQPFRQRRAVPMPTEPQYIYDLYPTHSADRDWRPVDFLGDGAPCAPR